MYARIKKRTNSKRSLDLDDDSDGTVDTSISEDVNIAIQQARNKLNSLKVLVQTPTPSTSVNVQSQEDDYDDNDDDESDELQVESYFEEPSVITAVKMDLKTWKATVQSMIKTTLQQKFNISHTSDMIGNDIAVNDGNSNVNITSSSDSSPSTTTTTTTTTAVTEGVDESHTSPIIVNDSNTNNKIIHKNRLIKLSIIANRIEVIVSNGAYDDGELKEYDAEQLRDIHKEIYDMFETHDVTYNNTKHVLDVVARYEIMVATPGISDVLRFDRDFVSFQGFKVFVTTHEEINHKSVFEGTLVGRTPDMVIISLKGRKMNIPRGMVKEVRLPKAKTEPTDNEIRKLII